MIDRPRFEEYVQEVLGHLYDYAYLQTHPLAALIAQGSAAEARGRTLYRILVEAVDVLKPGPNVPVGSPAWRKYHCLFRRYIEGVAPDRVAAELGVTSRQSRRDQHEALEAIADILYAGYAARGRSEIGPSATNSGARTGLDTGLESELSRLAAEAPRGPTVLAEVVGGALATLSRLAESHGITLTFITAPDPLTVALDRSLLRQILLALLNCIIEQPGATALVLTAESTGKVARLRIAAAGIPAPPAAESRLGMCERLLALQGGGLAYETVGSPSLTIILTLPVSRVATVLVVDDNPDVCLLFQRYLDRTYRVVQAHSATEALSLLQDVRPDVVTLDVVMPSADGWELLQQIRADAATRDVPVIVCSVVRDDSLAFSLGATELLPKPISREGLRSALERCLRSRE